MVYNCTETKINGPKEDKLWRKTIIRWLMASYEILSSLFTPLMNSLFTLYKVCAYLVESVFPARVDCTVLGQEYRMINAQRGINARA